MADSEPDIRNATRARIAVGHAPLHDDRPWRRGDPLAPVVWIEYGAPDGSVCAAAGDLAAYLRMLLNRGAGILDPASFALMTRPYVDKARTRASTTAMRWTCGRWTGASRSATAAG